MGSGCIDPCFFLTSALVGGQLDAPAALPPAKEPPVLLLYTSLFIFVSIYMLSAFCLVNICKRASHQGLSGRRMPTPGLIHPD
jgi:hypothetical protein